MCNQSKSAGVPSGDSSNDTSPLSTGSATVSEILQNIITVTKQERKPDGLHKEAAESSSTVATLHANETESEESTIDASEVVSPLAQLNAEGSEAVYMPMPPDEVRILIIHPGQPDEEIRCSFVYARLEQAPRYEALSYTWGSEANAKRILLCSQPFYVSASLSEALQYLRQTTTDRYVWIDALCINQSSIPERNAQVQRMREIYATAFRVLVWLGTGHFYSDLRPAHDFGMLTNTQYVFDLINLVEVNGFSDSWLEDADGRGELYLIRALDLILELEYWNRVWIVQEIAHAREAILQLGSKTTKYNSLVQFLKRLRHTRLANQKFLYHIESFAIGGPNKLVRPGAVLDEDYISIKAWQSQLKSRHCRDPRDRVFGYYGCLPPEVQRGIHIDYSKTEFEVFREATLAVLDLGYLPIICWAKGEISSSHPLSWVPTFGRAGGRNIADFLVGDDSFPRRINPSGKSFTLRDGDTTITLRVAIVGEVRTTHRYPTDPALRKSLDVDEFLPTFFWDFYCAWRRLAVGRSRASAKSLAFTMAGGTPERFFSEICERFVDTLDAFLNEEASNTAVEEDSVVQAARRLMAKRGNRPSLMEGFSRQPEMVKGLVRDWLEHSVRKFSRELGDTEYVIVKKLKGMSLLCAANRLFLYQPTQAKLPTNDLENLGLANEAISDRDKVCIVDGINAVVILRETGDNFTFISSAFVGNYMESDDNNQAYKLTDRVTR